MAQQRHVCFIHPDLGIGGAERLVVDAAVALHTKGYNVSIYTAHHHTQHCFPETITILQNKIFVHGDWLPRSLCGKFHIVFAILRMIVTAVYAAFAFKGKQCVFIVDQVPAVIPFLNMICPKSKVYFYCHFPDLLLAPRKNIFAKLYRMPFDTLEKTTMSKADKIVANSKFTRKIVKDTFSNLKNKDIDILYPSVKFSDDNQDNENKEDCEDLPNFRRFMVLSINRYERKKNIQLAIESFAQSRAALIEQPSKINKMQLVIAGGYDPRVSENVEYYIELYNLAKDSHKLQVSAYPDVNGEVVFIRSFSEQLKHHLFSSCSAVVYTPENEHFGIVPIEAMMSERPVIATKSGGPLESIANQKTGLLCDPTAVSFAEAITFILENEIASLGMGKNGRRRVLELFSFDSFADKLDEQVSLLFEDS